MSLTNLLLFSEGTIPLSLQTVKNSPQLQYQQKITLTEQFCQLEIIYSLKGLILWVTKYPLESPDNIQLPLISVWAESTQ